MGTPGVARHDLGRRRGRRTGEQHGRLARLDPHAGRRARNARRRAADQRVPRAPVAGVRRRHDRSDHGPWPADAGRDLSFGNGERDRHARPPRAAQGGSNRLHGEADGRHRPPGDRAFPVEGVEARRPAAAPGSSCAPPARSTSTTCSVAALARSVRSSRPVRSDTGTNTSVPSPRSARSPRRSGSSSTRGPSSPTSGR